MNGRARYVLVVILAQFLWLGGMCFFYWLPYRADGVEITVVTLPVDPVDFFRGQYVQLNYEFSRLQDSLKTERNVEIAQRHGKPVYAVLKKEPSTGFWRLDEQTFQFPGRNAPDASRVVIRGICRLGRVKYGIEQFFMQEGIAKLVEDAAQATGPDKDRVAVTLRITPYGRATVKSVTVLPAPETEMGAQMESFPTEIPTP